MDKYINADSLIRQLAMSDLFKGVDDFIDTNNSEVMEIIESMPAEDVEPVKHGKWQKSVTLNPRCSVCREFAICDRNAKPVLSKRCPNCGAKMDAE